jgi:hypothetical protein
MTCQKLMADSTDHGIFWVFRHISPFEVMDLDDRDPPMTDATEAPRSRRLTFLGLQFQGIIPRTGMCIVVIKF